MSAEKTFWSLFRSHIPKDCDVQRIETGSTGRGIPDINLCYQGYEFWIELKVVKGRSVDLAPEQVAWHYRRTRAGGTTWIIARDKYDKVKKGKGDFIYLWHGDCVVKVKEKGIECPGHRFSAPFDWAAIWAVLLPDQENYKLSDAP